MTCRIRKLENSVGAVYSTVSKEKHLLLSSEDMTLQVSYSVDVPMSTPPRLPYPQHRYIAHNNNNIYDNDYTHLQ